MSVDLSAGVTLRLLQPIDFEINDVVEMNELRHINA